MAPAAVTTAPIPTMDSHPAFRKESINAVEHHENSKVIALPASIPLTIDSLIRQRASEGSKDPIFSYPSSGIDYVDYTMQQLDVFSFRVASKYKPSICQRTSSTMPESVVALLGPSNFEYFVSILALTKLGHTILFLSTRISNAAYISLLQTTGAKHLLIDKSFQGVASEIKSTLGDLSIHEIADQSVFTQEINDIPQTNLTAHLDMDKESNKTAWIIHSSGSTGLPKPIFQTHRAALNNYAANLNMKGFVTLPLYHAHGISSVFRAIHSRKQIYLYNATLPLTQQYLLSTMEQNPFEIFYGVPYALKILGETPRGITALAKLKVVMFGGSACPDDLGRKLVDNGVNLISHYGT